MVGSSSRDSHIAHYKGYAMVLAAASLWGLSATVAQFLFTQENFRPDWLVAVRMISSGILLLALSAATGERKQIGSIWKEWHNRIHLIIFSVFGMLAVQYTYFMAIQTGNAATATLLQYLAPTMIVLYLVMRFRRLPRYQEISAVVLSMLGTFLLITDGSLNKLTISFTSIVWGIASAIALAFYTTYPVKLLKKWSSSILIGWAMIIGGVGISLCDPLVWKSHGQHWCVLSGLFVVFVVLFGTLIPFYLYLDSLHFISPSEACLLASVEPLSAAAAAILWLHVSFGIVQTIGAVCIICTVVILALDSSNRQLSTAKKEACYISTTVDRGVGQG